jgi:hypothetical protein
MKDYYAEVEEEPHGWLLQSFDARDWAAAFMKLFGDRKQDIDESLMQGWFANAIMRGYDEANHRRDRLPLKERAASAPQGEEDG